MEERKKEIVVGEREDAGKGIMGYVGGGIVGNGGEEIEGVGMKDISSK